MKQRKMKKWFLIGFYAADGNEKRKRKEISFCQNHKITKSVLTFLCQSLVSKTYFSTRDDTFNIFQISTVKKISDEKVYKSKVLEKHDEYVYDIETESLDFIC